VALAGQTAGGICVVLDFLLLLRQGKRRVRKRLAHLVSEKTLKAKGIKEDIRTQPPKDHIPF
jgi:hypothetical protein